MNLDNLFKLRTSGKYITQKELAKRSGYTQTYISLIETGKLRPSNRCVRAILTGLNSFGVMNKYRNSSFTNR